MVALIRVLVTKNALYKETNYVINLHQTKLFFVNLVICYMMKNQLNTYAFHQKFNLESEEMEN